MFGASSLGTYVNATRHRSKGNTKRLICRSFYYSPGLTFTRGSTSQTTDGVSTALTVFSPLFLPRSFPLFSLPSSYIPFILPLSSSTASKVFFRAQKIERCSIQVKVKEPFYGSKYFHTRCGFNYSWQTSVARFARRCRNRPAWCNCQTKYALLEMIFLQRLETQYFS